MPNLFIKYIRYLFCLVCLIHSGLQAQSYKKLIQLGDEAVDQNDQYAGKQFYKGAYKIDSTEIELWVKFAQAAFKAYDFSTSEYLYKKIIKKDNAKKFPLSTIDFANTLKALGKYKEANANYNKFIKKENTKKNKGLYTEQLKTCTMQIKSCEVAIAEKAINTKIVVTRLDSNISSLYSELGGLILNESTIIYSQPKVSSVREEGNAVRYQIVKKSNLSDLKNGFETILGEAGTSYVNFTFDSITKIAVCNKCEFEGKNKNCKLIALKFIDKKWKEDNMLLKNINVLSTQAFLTKINGRVTLFYTYGETNANKDLYWSTLNENVFETGKGLGASINSEADEITPFFSIQDSTLFFSSNRIASIGGYDVFKSRFRNGTFESAIRLSQPYNSSFNDLYFTFNEKNRKAILTSNRKGAYTLYDEGCCNDLFMTNYPMDSHLEKPKDSIQVLINKIKLISPLSLFFDNDEPDKKTTATTTNKTYETAFNTYLTKKEAYIENYSEDLAIEKKLFAKDAIELFYEDSIVQGMTNLKLFCAALLELVKADKKVNVILKAYTSSLASNAYNTTLAARRIYSLKNYFNTYNNGALLPYLNPQDTSVKGKIAISELKIGELALPKSSEDLEDLKNSVYGPNAMAERKIEIISIEID